MASSRPDRRFSPVHRSHGSTSSTRPTGSRPIGRRIHQDRTRSRLPERTGRHRSRCRRARLQGNRSRAPKESRLAQIDQGLKGGVKAPPSAASAHSRTSQPTTPEVSGDHEQPRKKPRPRQDDLQDLLEEQAPSRGQLHLHPDQMAKAGQIVGQGRRRSGSAHKWLHGFIEQPGHWSHEPRARFRRTSSTEKNGHARCAFRRLDDDVRQLGLRLPLGARSRRFKRHDHRRQTSIPTTGARRR